MKPSPYNYFFDFHNSKVVLAYNSYSGAVAEIEHEQYAHVRELLANPSDYHGDGAEELFQCLRAGGFLVPDAVDQITALKVRDRSNRLDGATLTLTIAPTLACNFNCDYCYETRTGGVMNETTQNGLIQFVDRWLLRAEGLRICWFGGEPTLCVPVIARISEHLIRLAERYRVSIHPATIISNGFLLDAAMARRLKDLGVGQAQITLDGNEAKHNRRRKLHNGHGTFARIVENLCVAAEIIKINVRVNIDKENVDSAYDVVMLLQERGLLNKVRVSFAPVTPAGSVCSDIRDRCHDNEEFSHELVQIYRKLLDNGIRQVSFPRANLGMGCGAIAEGYFVVSPTGHLFKCWEDLSLSAEKSIGTVFNADLDSQQKRNRDMYAAWNPFASEKCHDCSILPICMGGCPARSRGERGFSCGACTTWKFNLGEMMELSHRLASNGSL